MEEVLAVVGGLVGGDNSIKRKNHATENPHLPFVIIMQMDKKKLFLIIIIVSILFLTKIITINGNCGYNLGHMAKVKGATANEWSCRCLGIKGGTLTSYAERWTCTGINLSENVFTNFMGQKTTNVKHPEITMQVENCNSEVNSYDSSSWPKTSQEWINDTTLQVTSYTSTFCGGARIDTPQIKLTEFNKIDIEYTITTDDAVTLCNCARKLIFTIKNLKNGSYEINSITPVENNIPI